MLQRSLPGSMAIRGRGLYFTLVLVVAVLLVALLCKASSAQEAEADVFVARAVLAYEEKRYEEALAALKQALELDPNHVDALYYTGLVRTALGRLEEAAEALEKARALDPKDEAILFQLGVIYFSLRKYDQAQPLLEQVFAVKPTLDSLGYYVGFMRYRTKDYQGALRAFRAGASVDLNIQQLTRFYTGLALGILGLPERAAVEIEEALRLQPASPLTQPAERLRKAVAAAREEEQRLRAEVRLGGLYDDNVPVVPDSSSDSLAQSIRAQDKESSGELAALRLDYTFFRRGSFEATATYSFFTIYENSLPSFNIMDHLGGLSATYRGLVATLPYQFALQYTYDFLTLDEEEFVQRHTVTPFFVLLENPNNLTALQARFQNKEFSDDANIAREEKRDANNWMVGATHIFRFQGDKHLLKIGYQWDFDDAEGSNFRYSGQRALAG
ncbi:MAG: tetratricopeptide repeat protein, partial [Anaerolineae bacterium]